MKYTLLSNINHFDLPIVESILNKNDIDFFLKMPYDSSVIAGWAAPAIGFNEKTLFVEAKKIDLVRKLLAKYIL